MNIYLIGFMGSGKTTMGRQLAEELAYSFVDLDEYIEEKCNKTISEIFKELGENEFRKIERSALTDSFGFKDTIIATGGGTPCYFDNMTLINKNGLSIYLEIDVHTLVKRLRNSPVERPLIKNKTEKELSDFIFEKLQEREPFYSKSYFSIDNEIVSPAEMAKIIRSIDI